MRSKNILIWSLLIFLVAGPYLVFVNARNIMDWFALRNYDPPARIVQLADQTTMKPETRRLFYINHPKLDDKLEFKQHCHTTEQSIILGCYVDTQGIFLLDVKEKRLQGVVEVTAAHEVLHAVYERLSMKEKDKVDKMTHDFFKNVNDERLLKTVENYRKKDPSIVPNELHSILGTEVKELSAELEEYYSQYFDDRKQIVKFSEQYEQTFIDLQNQVEKLDQQLEALKGQIDFNQAEIEQKNAEILQSRNELDKLLDENKIDEYNAQVANFNALVGAYNRLINSTKQQVSRYNQLVEERNSLVTAEQELKEALDSNIIPEVKKQ